MMRFLTSLYVSVRERKGQSMTEYALIMAAIAVAAFTAYNTLGSDIVSLVTNVSTKLTGAI